MQSNSVRRGSHRTGISSVEPTSTALPDVVAAYLRHIQTVKTPASFRVDSWYVRRIFRGDGIGGASLSAEFIEDITPGQVYEFLLTTVRARGLSPKSANRYREIICRVFNWAVRYCGVRLAVNPGAMIEHFRERARVIRFLTIEDIATQLSAVSGESQLHGMVAALIYAGLRRSELLWLTPRDVDLASGRFGVLRICAKTVGGVYWQPKTGVNRVVPVSSALLPHLRAYEESADSGRSWYFPSPAGVRWDPDNFCRRLRAVNKAAGISWTCLDFRHTFGSQLAMKGESLYKISALLGNSPEICRRHYAVLMPESLYDAVEFPSVGA